jgi:hypothetical protein|tara:strand:- start:992 stop:1480 length:489 start_codon:yes stop_codon:yes gene_type:complete
MWIIIKYKRSEYSLLLSQISKKIKDIKIYCPKLIYEKNNKFFTNYILEDYLFCFHENFNDKKIYSKLKYLKGLSSILDGCSLNQDQIIEFINLCKENEDPKGNIAQTFFHQLNISKARFLNGPFSNLIFEILENKKKLVKCTLGSIIFTLNKKSNLYYKPVK